jgi:hypothetical protein
MAKGSSTPILDVEIIVPPNKETRIKIYSGDSVIQIVKQFAKTWNLNQNTQGAIAKQVLSHLTANNLLYTVKEGQEEFACSGLGSPDTHQIYENS